MDVTEMDCGPYAHRTQKHFFFFFFFFLWYSNRTFGMTFWLVHNSNGPRWTRTMWNEIWKPPTIDTSEYIAVRRSIFLLSSKTCGILYRSSIYYLYSSEYFFWKRNEGHCFTSNLWPTIISIPMLPLPSCLFLSIINKRSRKAERKKSNEEYRRKKRKEKGTLYIYNII